MDADAEGGDLSLPRPSPPPAAPQSPPSPPAAPIPAAHPFAGNPPPPPPPPIFFAPPTAFPPASSSRGSGRSAASRVVIGLIIIIAISAVGSVLRGDKDADVRVGDCVNGVTLDHRTSNAKSVSCSDPHDAEVYAIIDLPAAPDPGDSSRRADAVCVEDFAPYVGEPLVRSDLTSVVFVVSDHDVPHQQLCLLSTMPAKLTGSRRGTGAASDADVQERAVVVLEEGDCFAEPDDETVPAVEIEPCAEPHFGEVFSVFDFPDGDFPGDSEIADAAYERCASLFEPFVGHEFESSSLDVLTHTSTREQWTSGDRRTICTLVSVDGVELVGSMEGKAI